MLHLKLKLKLKLQLLIKLGRKTLMNIIPNKIKKERVNDEWKMVRFGLLPTIRFP